MNSKKIYLFIKTVFLFFVLSSLAPAILKVNLNFDKNIAISGLLSEGVLIAPNWVLGSILQTAPASVKIEGQELRVISVHANSPSRQFMLMRLEKPYVSSTLVPISRARFQELKELHGHDFLFPVIGTTGETLVGESRVNDFLHQPPIPISYASSRPFLSEQSAGVFLKTPTEPKIIGLTLPSYSKDASAVLHTLTLKDQIWMDGLMILDALGGDMPSSLLFNQASASQASLIRSTDKNLHVGAKLMDSSMALGMILNDRVTEGSTKISGMPLELIPLASPVLGIRPLVRARTSLNHLSEQNLFIRDKNRWNSIGKPNVSGSSSLIPQSLPLGTAVFAKQSEEYYLVGIAGGSEKGTRIFWLVPEVQNQIDNAIIAFALSGTPLKASNRSQGTERIEDSLGSPGFIFEAHDREEAEWNIMIWCNDQDNSGGRIFDLMRLLAEAANSPSVRIFTQYKVSPFISLPIQALQNQVIDDFRGTRRFVIQGKKKWKDMISEDLASQGVQIPLEDIDGSTLTSLKTPILKGRIRYQSLDSFNSSAAYEATFDQFIDMGSKQAFIEFLNWCKKFPAKKQALIIWTHGGAWRWISSDMGSALSIIDLREALSSVFGTTMLDLLRFDSCRTQMLEVAYELRDRAKYIMGSQQVTPIDLAPLSYGTALNNLSERPKVVPKDLALQMLGDYQESMVDYINQLMSVYVGPFYLSNIRQGKFKDFIDRIPHDDEATWSLRDGYTMSVLNTSKIAPVYQKLTELTALLIRFYGGSSLSKDSLKEIRKAIVKFGDSQLDLKHPDMCVDLFDLVDKLEQLSGIDLSIKNTCQQIKSLLAPGRDQLIMGSITGGENMAKSHGISIYFPPKPREGVDGRSARGDLLHYSTLQMNQVEPSWYSWIMQAE